MKVRAKMRVTAVQKAGDPKFPNVRIDFGAVYSSDPDSENRSFARATPSASMMLMIDPNMPAADAFVQGEEVYVDITPCGKRERTYLKDWGFVPGTKVVLESKDRSKQLPAVVNDQQRPVADLGDEKGERMLEPEELMKHGYEYWRHA